MAFANGGSVVHPIFQNWIFSGDLNGSTLTWFVEEEAMHQRFDVSVTSPGGMKAMLGLASFVKRESGLEHSLLELIKIRISQINGCAFCIAMHVPEARNLGETDDRIHLLPAWRETPLFTPRERAALTWAEAVARLENGEVPDGAYEEVRRHFTESEITNLTFAAVEISGWNRLMIASRTPPQMAKA
jgi:AhpD family alkylhydroperoxidase